MIRTVKINGKEVIIDARIMTPVKGESAREWIERLQEMAQIQEETK